MKYVYPAIFKKDQEIIFVSFPDIEGCCTQGNDMVEAIEMAQDALALTLVCLEDSKQVMPKASDLKDVQSNSDDIISIVMVDTLQYRKETSKKAVKKTLTIPSWLNEIAEKNEINFSQVLQEALINELNIK